MLIGIDKVNQHLTALCLRMLDSKTEKLRAQLLVDNLLLKIAGKTPAKTIEMLDLAGHSDLKPKLGKFYAGKMKIIWKMTRPDIVTDYSVRRAYQLEREVIMKYFSKTCRHFRRRYSKC